MSWQATSWASQVEDERLSVGERFLLFSLCNYADENWSCYPGVETLAKLTGQSGRTVIRQAARLEDLGYVRRERRARVDGKRTSDRWFILSPAEAKIRPPDQPPTRDQVTNQDESHQVTDCHVTNDPAPGDNCVTYIEEGISVENPSSLGRLPEQVDDALPDMPPSPKGEEIDLEAEFGRFWSVYPKRGRHANPKKPAKTKFMRLAKTHPPEKIIEAAQAYAKSRAGEDPQFTAQAVTWLGQERFTDREEPPPPKLAVVREQAEFVPLLQRHQATIQSRKENQ